MTTFEPSLPAKPTRMAPSPDVRTRLCASATGWPHVTISIGVRTILVPLHSESVAIGIVTPGNRTGFRTENGVVPNGYIS